MSKPIIKQKADVHNQIQLVCSLWDKKLFKPIIKQAHTCLCSNCNSHLSSKLLKEEVFLSYRVGCCQLHMIRICYWDCVDWAVARKHRIRIKSIEETNLWLTPIEENERILFKVLWVYTEANNKPLCMKNWCVARRRGWHKVIDDDELHT